MFCGFCPVSHNCVAQKNKMHCSELLAAAQAFLQALLNQTIYLGSPKYHQVLS